MTHREGMRLKAISEVEMQDQFPRTFAYLKQFETLFRECALLKRYHSKDAPFYSMFDVGDYTFARFKVVWREVANEICCAVADESDASKVVIPDHTLTLADCTSSDEAHFLCATLNSSPSQFAVKSYIALHPSPHVLENIRVPRYEPTDPVHRGLAKLSKQAHRAARESELAKLQTLEMEIDQLAAQVWSLTAEELRGIQRSLKEMS